MDRLIITIPLLFLLICGKLAYPADLNRVETMGEGCPGCVSVERVLVAKGVSTVRTCKVSAKSISPYYPRCFYSDGSKDSGQNVINGRCGFASPVKVVTWMEKKEKKK